jgi:hypothetical protein
MHGVVQWTHVTLKEFLICTTPFMVFDVTYPILRCMLGYINHQQLCHKCHTRHSSVLANILTWVCSIVSWVVCLSFTVKYKLTERKLDIISMLTRIPSSCLLKCKHMTLAISVLKNIFPLDIETQSISSIPICYTKYLIIHIFPLHKVTYVDKYYHFGN